MGIRIVKFKRFGSTNGESDLYDHDALYNRDLKNQHPIYAITGLIEILNILEDSITDTNNWVRDTNIRIDNILLDIEAIQADINILSKGVIKCVENTNSISIDFNESTNTLKASVNLYDTKNESNAIIETSSGLYVPKIHTEDTKTVSWSADTKGESLRYMYDNGIVFSHSNDSWSNMSNVADANAWYWDDTLGSFTQSEITETFTGFVSNNFYDDYTHTATLKSTDSDNDLNGIIIGFVFDENGNPHTLSAVCDAAGSIVRWGVIYDYMLPDQRVIFSSGNVSGGTIPSNRPSNWAAQPNGITIQVTKNDNLITCTCSNWGDTALNALTKISFDLNNYDWGYLFKKQVRYGYCSCSQPNSYFTDIQFSSKSTKSSGVWYANVKLSSKSGNGITIEDDGLYTPKILVSLDAYNRLELRSDGYYVKDIMPSTKDDNAFERLDDGTYYVREHSNIKAVLQASHGFSIGDFIYYHPVDKYQKAAAIDDFDSNIVGMVTKIIDKDNFEYQWSGFFATTLFNTSNGYTQGMPIYISNINPGKVTQEQPDVSKAVGYPVENIGVIISIERGIQYNVETTIGDFKISSNTYNVRSDGFIRIATEVDYKQSLIDRLLDVLDEDFKTSYLVFYDDRQTVQFQNIEELYVSNKVPDGLNLFIKAF